MELIAWIAGPWAAGKLLGGWAILPAAVILVAIPAVFSTPGDKHQVLVPTPGVIRLMLELDLGLVAAGSAWYVWPPSAAILATIVVVLTPIAGWRRARWLMRGAPPVD
jgi:hypothetical protein